MMPPQPDQFAAESEVDGIVVHQQDVLAASVRLRCRLVGRCGFLFVLLSALPVQQLPFEFVAGIDDGDELELVEQFRFHQADIVVHEDAVALLPDLGVHQLPRVDAMVSQIEHDDIQVGQILLQLQMQGSQVAVLVEPLGFGEEADAVVQGLQFLHAAIGAAEDHCAALGMQARLLFH